MFRLIPAPLHRIALRLAYALRHHWRMLRGTPVTGCQVIVRDFSGAILLMRHSYGPAVWALPGGGIGGREEPEAAARREVREETGLEAAELLLVTVIEEEISGSPHCCHLFSAISHGHARPDGREVIDARFFPLHSLPEPLGLRTRQGLSLWREWMKSQ